jgi:hypothetical protein
MRLALHTTREVTSVSHQTPQLAAWRAAVRSLEANVLDVWSTPLVATTVGFGLAVSALLAPRLLAGAVQEAVQVAALAGLTALALFVRWHTRGRSSQHLAEQIVARSAQTRRSLASLSSMARLAAQAELRHLTRSLDVAPVAALAAMSSAVSALAAADAAAFSLRLFPDPGLLGIVPGLALAALLLPAYVRLLTLTAARRLEERARLVDALVELSRES